MIAALGEALAIIVFWCLAGIGAALVWAGARSVDKRVEREVDRRLRNAREWRP